MKNISIKYVLLGIFALIIAAGVLFSLFVFGEYRSLAKAQLNLESKYSQVDNQMQRRADLIPNLVSSVKGYAKHEEKAIQLVSDARAKLGGAQTPVAKDEANTELNGALSRLMMITENYPDLKADKSFSELNREITGSENRIATARKDYISAVQSYNSYVTVPPTSLFAGIFGFQKAEQFKADESAKTAPKVEF